MEEWRDIPRFNGWYQASNLGRIRSLFYNGGRRKTPKILKLRKRKDGYLDINIMHVKKLVHVLVWEAFNGPVPDGYEINHINCVRDDNSLDNLSIMSHYDNVKWDNADEKKGKPVLQYTIEGEFVREWATQKEIERELGFDQTSISSCCLGRTITSHGFVWSFKDHSSTRYNRL